MLFVKQFMGQGALEFLSFVLVVEGEWKRLKLVLAPAHFQVGTWLCLKVVSAGQSHWPTAQPSGRGTGRGAQDVLV